MRFAKKWFAHLTQFNPRLQRHLQPLKTQILNEPYYRLQSGQEVEFAASLGATIDVNQANVDDWLRLPGLSLNQAKTLVALRQAGVQFNCLEDLAAALSLPVQQLQAWLPILRFCYYDADSLYKPQPINPNYASVEQLIRIPIVDLHLARTLIQQRQKKGPYRSLVELQQRLELSADLTAELMHYLCF
ncbi:MAG: ComEA family DNA-binding protein [Cyanothece sp. SIO1E1]|nr:ComEA family DNA-binding protein [Cyanothece sp. SIO1E1]